MQSALQYFDAALSRAPATVPLFDPAAIGQRAEIAEQVLAALPPDANIIAWQRSATLAQREVYDALVWLTAAVDPERPGLARKVRRMWLDAIAHGAITDLTAVAERLLKRSPFPAVVSELAEWLEQRPAMRRTRMQIVEFCRRRDRQHAHAAGLPRRPAVCIAVTPRRGARSRGAGRPAAAASRSSARSGDSGDGDGSPAEPADADRSSSSAPLPLTRLSMRHACRDLVTHRYRHGGIHAVLAHLHEIGWTVRAQAQALYDAGHLAEVLMLAERVAARYCSGDNIKNGPPIADTTDGPGQGDCASMPTGNPNAAPARLHRPTDPIGGSK